MNKGFVALYLTIVLLSIVLGLGIGVAIFTSRQERLLYSRVGSNQAYYAASAAVEDAVYRIKNGLMYAASYTLEVASSTATVTVSADGDDRTIAVAGEEEGGIRKLEAALTISDVPPQFFYGVQVGDGGLTMSNNSVVNGNVYSNGNIVGSNGAIIMGDATVAGGITDSPNLEWPTQNANQLFATASTNRDIAQSFTAPASGSLNRVSVYLAKVGSPSNDLTIRITADNGNKPSSSDLADATILRTSVGAAASWIDVAFEDPATVTSGTKYWIVLDYGANSATNHWNWRKDSSDGYASNTGKYTSSWSSGSAVWTSAGGDLAFRVWVGGVNMMIDSVTIGNATSGTGYANMFVDTIIHGSACPNQYCVVENPSREEMPISDGVIQDWRDAASAGGTCAPPTCDSSGNLTVSNGASKTIGPLKIPGNLTLSNNATLVLTGTVWVEGDIAFSNGCIVRLDVSYGSNSGVLMSDDAIAIANNCALSGSGTSGSYILLLSDKNTPLSNVMTISNNSVGVIYYAAKGRIAFSNNATAKEATAYGITLSNGATITYESGLANLHFSSGPGTSFQVKKWREIE